MTSFRIGLDPKRRRIGRFIAAVQAELRKALSEEQARGLTQQAIADKLGIDKSALSRRFNGRANLTLATIAELAHGLGREPKFSLDEPDVAVGRNHTPADIGTTRTTVIGSVPLPTVPGTTGASLGRVRYEAADA